MKSFKRSLRNLILLIICLLIIKLLWDNHTNKIEETSSLEASKDKMWWLNSGAIVKEKKSIISTIQGPLSQNSYWQKAYQKSDTLDTVNGLYPQNILRLITKESGKDIDQEMYVFISKINQVKSVNKGESNGVFLFQRYLDGDNLYYAGMRVDGNAVIKKKKQGIYYTLAEKKVLEGDYDQQENNLLPLNKWIGLKTKIRTEESSNISIVLSIDKEGDGNWSDVLEAEDNGDIGGAPIMQAGHGGIRTDFMDVYFKEYKYEEKEI